MQHPALDKPIGTQRVLRRGRAPQVLRRAAHPGIRRVPALGGQKVLEIGCGIGTDTINFAAPRAPRSPPSSCRRSRSSVAQQRAEVFGLEDRITIHTGNAEELPSFVAPRTIDLVYSFGVIHHSPHPSGSWSTSSTT